ncbi:uncharacterized protein [Palaemon carinicauda]|uniref:uncharacterized protein n=1 Tax=Palaemon carinicauda TaxID=392227 RepID=UPI0035B5A290
MARWHHGVAVWGIFTGPSKIPAKSADHLFPGWPSADQTPAEIPGDQVTLQAWRDDPPLLRQDLDLVLQDAAAPASTASSTTMCRSWNPGTYQPLSSDQGKARRGMPPSSGQQPKPHTLALLLSLAIVAFLSDYLSLSLRQS